MNTVALPPASPSSSSWWGGRVVVLAVVLPLVYALFGVTWMGFVPLMPEVTGALGVDKKDGTLLITVISMAKSIVPILTGLIAARLGMRRTLLSAGVLIVLGGAAPWVSDYSLAVLVRFVLGVGGAMWVTVMGSVVLAELPADKRPVANAVNGIAVNAGVIAALALTLPLAAWVGPRVALSIASVLSALCLVALVGVGEIGGAAKPASLSDTLKAYAATLKVKTTWLLAIAFCGPLALYLVLNTFLGAHLEQSFGVARAASMRWLSFMNLWGIPASIGAGLWLVKKPDHTRLLLVLSAVLLPTGVAAAVLVPTDGARAVAFAVAGFGTFLPVSPLITAMQKAPGQTPARLGMIFGTMFAVTYLVSAAVPTWVGGAVEAGTPLQTALLFSALLGLTPAVGLGLLRAR